jgi:hypothetical protein
MSFKLFMLICALLHVLSATENHAYHSVEHEHQVAVENTTEEPGPFYCGKHIAVRDSVDDEVTTSASVITEQAMAFCVAIDYCVLTQSSNGMFDA